MEDFEVDSTILLRRGFRFFKGAEGVILEEDGPDAHRMKRRFPLDGIKLIVKK